MVQASHGAVVRVRVLVRLGALGDVAGGLDHADRVLLLVGVEVAQQQDPIGAGPHRHLRREGDERLGLGDAVRVVGALAVPGVHVVAGGTGAALGLEVVGDGHDVGALDALGRAVRDAEVLGERLAGVVEVHLVVQEDGLADRGDLGGLVDEGVADDVLVLHGGAVRRGGDVGPLRLAGLRVQGVHEVREGVVAVEPELRGVLDLLEGDHGRVEAVDRGGDLLLLAQEVLGLVRAAGQAAVRGDGIALTVAVRTAAGDLLTQGGEVVEHVEAAHADVAADGLRGGLFSAVVLHVHGLHTLGVRVGELLERLE